MSNSKFYLNKCYETQYILIPSDGYMISNVRRSSQIPVQWCIRFDRQILLAHCNSTGFRSIGLQRQFDPTGSGSGLNIVKPNSTGFKYYPVRLDRLWAFVTYEHYKSWLKLRFVRYDVTGMLIMIGFLINCLLHNFGSPRSSNRTRPICWIMKTWLDRYLN